MFNETILFSSNRERRYNIVLHLESKDDQVIITYLDGKIKKKINISENKLNNYTFLQKNKNLFYKKYNKVNPNDLIKEMDTASAGIGGTADVAGSYKIDYAEGDNRNVTGYQFPLTRRPKITDTFLTHKKKKKKKKKSNGKKQKK